MSKFLRHSVFFLIVGFSTILHFKHFPKDLMSIHVWRQTQTQSTIDNFYEEDMNILNPKRNDRGDGDGIFRMEFPLMQWLVAVLFKIFGKHIIISRIFMFIVGLITTLGMYQLLQALFRRPVLSMIGAWTFTFSPSFFYYTINPLPDNLALCLSLWGLVFFFQWYNKPKKWLLTLCGVFLSLGALCKLPFIAFYAIPLAYFAKRFLSTGNLSAKVISSAIRVFGLSILPLSWYASVIPDWSGNPIVQGMLNNQKSISKILDYYQHNLFSTLPELLLNYGSVLFFLSAFYFLIKKKAFRDARFMFLVSLSAVLLAYFFFEVNAIAKIHDYYLFPFYPLLFVLVSYGAYHLIHSGGGKKYLAYALLILLPITCYLRMQARWNPDAPGFNKDLLLFKEELRNAVPKDALVVAGNDESHFIFFYYIDKKGWGFHEDQLNFDQLLDMVNCGAEFLYSDSKKVSTNPVMAPLLEEMVIEKGSIKIFRLKSSPSRDLNEDMTP